MCFFSIMQKSSYIHHLITITPTAFKSMHKFIKSARQAQWILMIFSPSNKLRAHRIGAVIQDSWVLVFILQYCGCQTTLDTSVPQLA